MHTRADNHIEAGFTLKLYADSLNWNSVALRFTPNTDNNGLPEAQMKEMLYLEIIKHFDKGNCWEKGIPICKELANYYETKLFNYKKLSEILRREAQLFENILEQVRPDPEYFRVGFYGKGFPSFVRVSNNFNKVSKCKKLNFLLCRINCLFSGAWNTN